MKPDASACGMVAKAPAIARGWRRWAMQAKKSAESKKRPAATASPVCSGRNTGRSGWSSSRSPAIR
jgi:hypothetical protein